MRNMGIILMSFGECWNSSRNQNYALVARWVMDGQIVLFRKCAIERKVEYCAFCSDYPCETMKRLGYTKYADELKIGVENFLKKKLECE